MSPRYCSSSAWLISACQHPGCRQAEIKRQCHARPVDYCVYGVHIMIVNNYPGNCRCGFLFEAMAARDRSLSLSPSLIDSAGAAVPA